ncbi:hypothetical protein INR49_031208 [Caranx melampygus]|nr:hypothetical protein INR49_031208 [Caranx melampygus]
MLQPERARTNQTVAAEHLRVAQHSSQRLQCAAPLKTAAAWRLEEEEEEEAETERGCELR